ncbi:hypothetical protein BGW37DRAFT_509187 [Umbelopsis sp. PMI_123]|nr:hypothetical protein BGW37DRAFT_509187 [Umbelopsis sp. PMI_123]
MGTNPESVKSGRIITNDIIKCIFSQLANEDILMKTIFHDLLRDDSDKEELIVSDAYLHLKETVLVSLEHHQSQYLLEALSWPYYQAIGQTLNECYAFNGKLPDQIRSSPFEILPIVNSSRMVELEEEMERMFSKIDSMPENTYVILLEFFREFVLPNDIRTLLLLRTTEGSSSLDIMPPSLEQCMMSFTQLHQTTVLSNRRGVKPSQLTVGGKAFSKHVHRDLKAEFWGVCKGNEEMKNEAANTVLANIMCHPVWRNLHELPHGILAYEIRNAKGYGARWTAKARISNCTDVSWMFRGFLEPPMKDGHSVGWMH